LKPASDASIGNPVDGRYAIQTARGTNGTIDACTEAEVIEGIRLLAETEGVFTETAGGVTIGVLSKLAEAGAIGSDERVVVYITGEGLKTLDAARESFQMHEIDPTLDAFHQEFEAVAASA
jgi:threonine synthase